MAKIGEREVWKCHCGHTEPYEESNTPPTHTHTLVASAIGSEIWATDETVQMYWAKIEYHYING